MTREEIRRENARKLASGKGGKAAFARLVEMEASQVSQLIGPKPSKNIGNSIARRIERAHHLPDGWLDVEHPEMAMQTEEGEQRTDEVEAVTESSSSGQSADARPFDENVLPALLGTRPIPVISAVQAGALRDMESPYEPGDGYAVEYTDDMRLSRWTFGLDVEGESMKPRFQEGDRLIVDPERSPKPGCFVVARNGSNQATFKKYRPRGIDSNGNEIFELVPLNDDYPTLRSDTEKLIIIGVVTEVRQKLI